MRYLSFLILITVLTACPQDPNTKLAGDFLDAYFVTANHEAALTLSEGQAWHMIEAEKKLLASVDTQSNAEAYRSRDVLFKLKKRASLDGAEALFYTIEIIVPQMESSITKMVTVIVNTKTYKVKTFLIQ